MKIVKRHSMESRITELTDNTCCSRLFTTSGEIENSPIADKPRDAFRGQSRSPNMVPFHMLGMVSCYCSIVTLSVIRTVFEIFEFKKCRDLENRVRGREGH